MKSVTSLTATLVLTWAALSGHGSVAQAAEVDGFVAGLQPDQRPDSAPRIARFEPDAALKAQRLAGVSAPWPGNLARIAAQGAWYSPMFQRGMTGRYDLRSLHGEHTP